MQNVLVHFGLTPSPPLDHTSSHYLTSSYGTGANIDMGHHENRARYAMEEASALDDAVVRVTELTSSDDSLVVVSADHSHAFTFGGKLT